ncbi:MAG: Nif3-like dinuclear metal center hexameric protein [Clostridia bacterium]|nr:Nif3-like dinuclear metal center hexameric protein [Clostridia bacterium]
MKANELFLELIQDADIPENTCDTLKAGDPDKVIRKVGITMFATVEVIKAAAEWGADMLITHEPTYYNHHDQPMDDPVYHKKRALLEESGMTVYRYHDGMHFRKTDRITEGELQTLGITGSFVKTPYAASYRLIPDTPISAKEVISRAGERLGIRFIRAAGDLSHKAKTVAACFGTPGGVFELLRDPGIDMVLTGESCEWALCEYARDSSALGIPKALVVMGHIGSEKGGMIVLRDTLAATHPELTFRYFECGEVYE